MRVSSTANPRPTSASSSAAYHNLCKPNVLLLFALACMRIGRRRRHFGTRSNRHGGSWFVTFCACGRRICARGRDLLGLDDRLDCSDICICTHDSSGSIFGIPTVQADDNEKQDPSKHQLHRHRPARPTIPFCQSPRRQAHGHCWGLARLGVSTMVRSARPADRCRCRRRP